MRIFCEVIKRGLQPLFGVLLLFTSPGLEGGYPVLEPERVVRYGVFETRVTNPKTYHNPFDYREIELQALFTAPSGRTARFIGFYAGDGEGGQRGQVWKLRFMPDEAGLWKYTYFWTDGTPGGSGEFQVVETGLPGPLGIDPGSPRYFSNARGEPFHWRGYDVRYLPPEQNHVAWRGSAAGHYIDVIRDYGLPRGYNFFMINVPSSSEHDQADQDFGSWWYQGERDRFDLQVWRNFETILDFALQHGVYLIPFDGFVAQPSAGLLSKPLLRYTAARLGPYASYMGYSPTWEYYDVFSEQEVDGWMTFFQASLPENSRPLLTAHDYGACAFANWQDFLMRQGANDGVVAGPFQANRRDLDVHPLLRPYNHPIIGSEDIWESPGELGERLRYPATAVEIRQTAWAEMLAGVMPLYSEWSWFLWKDAPARLGQGLGEPEVRRMFDFLYSRTHYRSYQQLNELVDGAAAQMASGAPGLEYLVYDLDGGTISLDLSEAPGQTGFTTLWFDPEGGRESPGKGISGGEQVELKSPFQGETILLVKTTEPNPVYPNLPARSGLGICQGRIYQWRWLFAAGVLAVSLATIGWATLGN